jgi:hypothetical protein
MQRLGQLSPAARNLAGVCATVGRAFTFDVLRRTLTQGDEALAGVLDELARRGIVREQSSHRAYDFAITLLARTHVLAGEIVLGLIALDDAAAIATETGQRFLDAELLRLRAELLAQQFAAPELIRRFLRQACAIARRQGAIALELRAALSLARMEERAGQRAKGCAGLRPVFARFREGFETADLRDAAEFLNEKP